MKMSRFARSLTSLVLALIMIMSTSMSAFALWVPDSVLDKYEDDEEEENESNGSSIFDSVQSRLDDDDDEEKTTTSNKTSTSGNKIVIIKKDGSKVTAGSSSSSTSGKKVVIVSKNNSDDEEVVSPTQSGKVIPKPGTNKTTTTSSSSTTSHTATSNLAATIKKAQSTYNNKDIKGWLKVDGTNVNYGVVQTPSGKSINYYEALGYDKKYSKNGVLWTNPTAKFGSSSNVAKNTVIFGHNWTNSWRYAYANRTKDVMFAQLVAFKNLDFAKKNQKITFGTEKEDMTYQIFAVFICNADKFNYVTANPTASNHQKVINEARSLSFFDYDVDVDSNDKIITLSTCIDAYYKNGVRQTNQRLVIMGKLVKGDEASTSVTVTTNKDAKTPTF